MRGRIACAITAAVEAEREAIICEIYREPVADDRFAWLHDLLERIRARTAPREEPPR